MKKFLYFMMVAMAMVCATSCSDDDAPSMPNPDFPTVSSGVFVLNEGNYYSQIEGSLTFYDYATQTAHQNVFQAANGVSLGSTPQAAVVYGDYIYIAVYESNVIQIVDRETFRIVKTISLAGKQGSQPRALVAKDGMVYISMYDGYVSRLDTNTLEIDKTIAVGPNPEVMAIRGAFLYVPNSGGLNYLQGYNNTVSKIDLNSFTVVKTITTSVNPTKFATNGDDLFLLCMGNYNDIDSEIYQMGGDDSLTLIGKATMMDVCGANLYYINAPYYLTTADYKVYNVQSKTTTDMLKDTGVDSPCAIAVDPITRKIFISSYTLEMGYASYNTNGYVKIYNPDGSVAGTFEAGVGPRTIFFNQH